MTIILMTVACVVYLYIGWIFYRCASHYAKQHDLLQKRWSLNATVVLFLAIFFWLPYIVYGIMHAADSMLMDVLKRRVKTME